MKLLSVSSAKGVFEIFSVVDVPNRIVKFQALANGLVFCESKYYDDLREVVLEAVAINSTNRQVLN